MKNYSLLPAEPSVSPFSWGHDDLKITFISIGIASRQLLVNMYSSDQFRTIGNVLLYIVKKKWCLFGGQRAIFNGFFFILIAS